MKKQYMDEPVDLKRLMSFLIRRAFIVLLSVAVGALIGLCLYKAYTGITNGEPKYRITDDYYITFDFDKFIHATDYYNAYTWNEILHDDPIVDRVMAELPEGTDREEVLASVTSEMLSDYRILTVYITAKDPELTDRIATAYNKAMFAFGEQIDMITVIELWSDGDVVEYNENTRGGNAAILGAILGFVISFFALLIMYLADDGIYSERDWRNRYKDIVFLGAKGSEMYKKNKDFILGEDKDYPFVNVSDIRPEDLDYDPLRNAGGVILEFTKGRDKGRDIDEMIYALEKQNVDIVASCFTMN
ncbi:MAG: hypothetical protein K5662_01585 [Lachnospiraceae bacterium]|nr:hypothetical protein [Lachnospiraceae bacterium]